MNNHIKISLALLSVSLCQAAAKENKNDRPNIVIIYCDDMGYGDIGVTGPPGYKKHPIWTGWLWMVCVSRIITVHRRLQRRVVILC